MLKKAKGLLIILLIIVMLLQIGSCAAYAGTNFGQSPTTSDIVVAKRNNNGDIIVIDSAGRVYRFDYFKWYTINSNSKSGCKKAFYDNNLGKIIYIYCSGDYYNGRLATFDVNSLTWDLDIPLYYDIGREDCFYRAGKFYKVQHTGDYWNNGMPQLCEWNGSTWVLIKEGTKDLREPYGVTVYYDVGSDKVYAVFAENYSWGYVALYTYSFSSNSWTRVSDTIYIEDLEFVNSRTYKTIIFNGNIFVGGYYSDSDLNRIVNISTKSLVVSTSISNGVGLAANNYGWVKYSVGGNFEGANIGFNLYTIEVDKYGNLFLAGSGGKCAVRDLGGVIQTNSDFYTDYVINLDIKPDVKNAVTAANQARDAANAANSNAWNAYNAANTAKNEAVNAKNEAINAKNAANTASNYASSAASRVWDSAESKSAATLAKEARDKAAQTLSAVNNLQATVNNINNTITTQDSMPPSVELDTVSGAKATSSSSIQLIIAASDNKSSTFTYSINGGSYSSLPADGKITVSLPSIGPNTITVRVKDEAGNTTVKAIKIWRLN